MLAKPSKEVRSGNRKKEVQLIECFDQIHSFSYHFELDCVNKCRGNCEEGAVLLLPYENEYLSSKLKSEKLIFPTVRVGAFMCGFIGENDGHCAALQKNCVCNLSPWMPIDCLTYPVFPKFDIGENPVFRTRVDFYLSRFCPLYEEVTHSYISYAKKAWNILLPHIPRAWMEFYNGRVIGFFSQKGAIKV